MTETTQQMPDMPGNGGGRRAAPSPQRRRTHSAGALNNLLAAVPTLWLTVFFLMPLAFTVIFSFTTSTFAGIDYTFTFDNYRETLSGFYLNVFMRTILFAIMASALCLVVAYPVAYFMARLKSKKRMIALALILIPYFSSFLIRVMSLNMLISRDGFVQWVLNSLHLHSGPLDILDTSTAVFIGMVYAYLPITTIPLFVVLDKLPRQVLEAGRDLGAPPWKTFFFITLPLSRPGIATAVLLSAVPMLGEMIIPDLLGGSRGLLLGKALSSQYLQAQNYPLGSAMAVLILLVIGVLVAGLARLTKGFAETGR